MTHDERAHLCWREIRWQDGEDAVHGIASSIYEAVRSEREMILRFCRELQRLEQDKDKPSYDIDQTLARVICFVEGRDQVRAG